MAEITPNAAPQNPNQTATAVPPQTAQAAPPAAQPDVFQADNSVSAQPDPATDGAPTPSATASPKALPRRGLMASVLMGALHGADAAMKATGKAVEAAGKNSGIGQNIQNQKLARQAKQQEMQQAQQKAQQEQTASMDEHQIKVLQSNSMSMDNMHKAAENAQVESLYPLQTAEAKNTLIGQIQKQNEADRTLLTTLADAGIHLDTSHFTQGGPFEQLTADHASQIAHGKQIALNNGKTGQDADLAFVSNAELENTVLPHDVQVVTDWNLDPKTGAMSPVYSTLTAGQNTAMDALIAHDSGMDKFNQKQEMYTKQVEASQKAAQAQQEQATAQLDEAQAKQLSSMGITIPQNYLPDANNFSLAPVQLQQKLTSQGVKVPSDFSNLYAIAHYKMDIKTLPSRNYKGVAQTTQDQGGSYIRAFINPNYDENNLVAVRKMETEFADTRSGTAGGNLTAFNTATGHLGQLYSAARAMQNTDIPALNQIANTLGVATGQSAPVVYNGIRNVLIGELGKTFKGAAADIPEADRIVSTLSNAQSPQQMTDLAKTYAHAMLTKAGAQVAHYYAYTGELPPQTIDPVASEIYRKMGIDPQAVMPGGATAPVGGTGNQNPSSNATTVPQGKTPVYSKSTGQLKGYADDNNLTNYHPF